MMRSMSAGDTPAASRASGEPWARFPGLVGPLRGGVPRAWRPLGGAARRAVRPGLMDQEIREGAADVDARHAPHPSPAIVRVRMIGPKRGRGKAGTIRTRPTVSDDRPLPLSPQP